MISISTVGIFMVGFSACLVSGDPTLRFNSRIDVSQPNPNSNLGKVNGIRSCGGPGKAIEWRVEGCSGEGTCQLPGDDSKRKSELEFIPSQDIDGLGARFILILDGEPQTIYERPISDSSVQGGETYVVNSVGGAVKELKGKTVTLQYILYQVDNDKVDVCTEADFEIV